MPLSVLFEVRECEERLSAQNVGNALYGLRSLRDSAEARALVAALTLKVKQTPLDPRRFDSIEEGRNRMLRFERRKQHEIVQLPIL